MSTRLGRIRPDPFSSPTFINENSHAIAMAMATHVKGVFWEFHKLPRGSLGNKTLKHWFSLSPLPKSTTKLQLINLSSFTIITKF